jgi:hypothetical protein
MKKQDITYLDKLNELRLDLSHPNSKGMCFVLLEGETDIRLFRKVFNLLNCKVENIPGGKPKLEMAVSELLKTYELVIGLRDADFINLDTVLYSSINMFLTDFHDIEMSIINEDDVLSAIIFEFTNIPFANHSLLREQIITSIEKISLLKWLNDIEDLKIVFDKTGFQDLVSFENFRIDFEQYFARLLSKSFNAKITDINTINLKITNLKALNPHPYQLCNGHDFIKNFAQFIREKGKAKSINDELISSILRIKFTKEKFYKTNLLKLFCKVLNA